MRLTFVISSLSSGGAERAVTAMANYWGEKGWLVTIITLSGFSEAAFYELNPSVIRKPLGLMAAASNPIDGIANNFRRGWAIRRAVKESRADAVISFMDKINVVTLLATRGIDIPVLVSERIDPAMQPLDRIWNVLRRWSYRYAVCIVVQTKRAKYFFSRRFRTTTHVIPNPVAVTNKLEEDSGLNVPKPVIVAMGRLELQKGFDLLIQAFSRLDEHYDEWNLLIIGEGSRRAELKAMVKQRGLGGRVSLLGRIKNPHAVLRRADIFILPSRYEGFPNALLESMAVGLPVISFDCHSGPGEIIEDRVNGLLVPPEDVEALAVAMERLMRNEDERTRLGTNAKKVTEVLSMNRVMCMWEALLSVHVPAVRNGPDLSES